MMYGYSYKHLFYSAYIPYASAGCSPVAGGGFIGETIVPWIREDTSAGIVFYRAPMSDTLEHILYNYNLNVGDTIKINVVNMADTFITDSVESVDSILIDGVFHKRWGMQSKYNTYQARGYTIVEGIGSTDNPMWPGFFQGCFEYFERLKCFSQDGYNPPFTAPYSSCHIGEALDSINNTGDCISLSTRYFDKNPPLSINPNPATDHIAITGDQAFAANIFISAYDMTGRLVMRAPAEPKNS